MASWPFILFNCLVNFLILNNYKCLNPCIMTSRNSYSFSISFILFSLLSSFIRFSYHVGFIACVGLNVINGYNIHLEWTWRCYISQCIYYSFHISTNMEAKIQTFFTIPFYQPLLASHYKTSCHSPLFSFFSRFFGTRRCRV